MCKLRYKKYQIEIALGFLKKWEKIRKGSVFLPFNSQSQILTLILHHSHSINSPSIWFES